jgi:acetyl-CoA carboxylase carboxyl transferase subunit alpha
VAHGIEGAAGDDARSAILWGDSSKKQELSGTMKITAEELKALGVIDRVVPEPLGGAHWDPEASFAFLGQALRDELARLRGTDIDHLLRKRADKYAAMARFAEK